MWHIQESNSALRRDHKSYVFTLEKDRSLKNNAFNKPIARRNQLRSDHGFSS
jgi:hypothetical protein